MAGWERLTEHQRSLVEAHLGELLASPEFVRTQVQGRALAAMVRGRLDEQMLGGRDLAQLVYGRADEGYIRAIRQVKRELRFKLLAYYVEARPGPVRFDVSEAQYTADLVFARESAGAAQELPSSPATPPDASVGSLSAAAGPAEIVERLSPARAAEAPRRRPNLRTIPLLALGGLAAVSLLVATSRLGRSSAPDHGRLPALVAWRGEKAVVIDAAGQDLPAWSERLPALSPVPLREDPPFRIEARVAIVSIPGSGGAPDRVAILGCDFPLFSGDHLLPLDGCELRLVDAASGHVIGALKVPILDPDRPRAAPLHAPDDGDVEMAFAVADLKTAELDGDGRHDELVVALNHWRLFPAQVIAVEPGPPMEAIAVFWPMGQGHVTVLPDLDGDESDELVYQGQRNADQVAFAWLLPQIPASRGLVARTPNGRRPTMLEEVRALPVAGITLAFPNSPLAQPELPESCALRGDLRAVSLQPERLEARFLVRDAACLPGQVPGRLEYFLDLKANGAGLRFLDYDYYYRGIRRAVISGQLKDVWRLRETESLAGVASEMARRIEMFDASEPGAAWRPLDVAAVARRWPKGGAPEKPELWNP